MDGLAQRLSFQTDPVDGQNSVPYMDCPGPAGLAEQRRQKYQILPDSTDRQGGRPVRLPVLWLRQKQSSFLWQKKTRQPLFTVSFIWEKKKVPKGGTANSTNLMKVSLSSQITALTPLQPAIPPLYPSLTSLPGLSWWGRRSQWGQRAPLCQKSWCPVVRYISSAQLCRL